MPKYHHVLIFWSLQVIERAVDAVCYLRSLGFEYIKITTEDDSRSDPPPPALVPPVFEGSSKLAGLDENLR